MTATLPKMHIESEAEIAEMGDVLDYHKPKEKLSETNLESLTDAMSGMPLKKQDKLNMAAP